MINVAYPWISCFIVAPLIVYLLLPSAKKKKKSAIKVPFFYAVTKQLNNHKSSRISLPYWLLSIYITIWTLVVLSGMGFQWLGKTVYFPQNGRNIMMVIDLSGSMSTQDMHINNQTYSRLDVVKQVAKDFVEKRRGDRIGLVLFGSSPYLQAPLTFDLSTVTSMINDATIGLAGQQTAIGDALGLAVKKLLYYPDSSRAIILLTDGANNAGLLSPNEIANIAKDDKIRIYTIGLGSDNMVVNTVFGKRNINPSRDLDETMLNHIAKETGGRFFRAKNPQQLENIYHDINKLEPVQTNSLTVRPMTPLYPWFLGPAVLLSFLASCIILIRNRSEG